MIVVLIELGFIGSSENRRELLSLQSYTCGGKRNEEGAGISHFMQEQGPYLDGGNGKLSREVTVLENRYPNRSPLEKQSHCLSAVNSHSLCCL